MCGFAGFLSSAGFNRDELIDHAGRMIAPIVHRGPDDYGVWADERAGVAFGFRRLAILDLSPHGHQPMTSASGRFVVAFNGEIYNFDDLRRQLEPLGHRFRGHSDTEAMLAAFEQWGIRDAVRRFVGMFAVAVWDSHRRELSLFRDRLGKKPLFVYSEPGLVAFGSELKALVAGPSFDRSIDRSALASYLRYLYVPAPASIFRRVIKLPAASILTIADPDRALPAPSGYWSLREAALDGLANPLAGSEAETVDRLDDLLKDAVRCRLQSDVPLGALLSGGIDSSTVVALMREATNGPVKTYTIAFDDHDFDEARDAARVARHLETDHTELMLTGDEACALVPQLPQIFDEPLADPSQVPTLVVSRLARQHVTVALCGDGGDELFAGYNRYVYGTRVLPRVGRLPLAIRQPVGSCLGGVPAAAWDRMHAATAAVVPSLTAQRVGERIHKLGAVMTAASTAGMYRSLLSAWQRPESVVMGGELDADCNDQILESHQPAHLLDRMMLADQTTYLPDDLLAKVDRASMAASLEVRAPLLDHRVAEFSWRLPRALKLRGTIGKWILRQVLYRRVPRELVDRPKMGFSVPIDRWLRGPLRNWAEDLLPPASDDLLDGTAIRRAWNDLQAGRRHSGTSVWAVVMFQAWRARWQS